MQNDSIQSELAHSKACNLSDFSHPDLIGLMRAIFPEKLVQEGPIWPLGVEERKCWEVAMAVRALSAGGVLRPDAEVLGIGAGREATLFWLTRDVRRVFATDLYLAPGWESDANAQMLSDSVAGAPVAFDWNPRRLVAQHMDALSLNYEDQSFDAVFSSSSIEHFGDLEAVAHSIDEAFRVLKPGGVFSVSTELRVAGPGPGLPGVLMFTPDDLVRTVIGNRDWAPLEDRIELDVDQPTREAVASFASALADISAGRPRYSQYPHVVLEEGPHQWTSVHLALRRRDPAA